MVNAKSVEITESSPHDEFRINDSPLKWCSVSLRDVSARGERLEASVFDVEAMQARNLILHGKYHAVYLFGDNGPVEKAYYGGRQKRYYVDKQKKGTIGFLGSSEMLDCQPRPVKYMIDDDKVNEMRVQKGLVLISRSGTIGNVTYVGETLSRFLVSEHAIRLECKNNPGFVYAFLKSKIGKLVVCSTQYGAVIHEIEPEHLATIPIPDAPVELKRKINDLIIRSFDLRDESNELIDRATSMLIAELNLPDVSDFEADLYKKDAPVDTFNVRLSGVSGRFDASYHEPIVDAIVNHLRQYAEEVINVGDPRISTEVILPGRFKRTYVEEAHGVRFLGGKEIHQLAPSTEKYLSRKAHHTQIEKSLGIRPYAILTPARGSLGEVELPGEQFIGWAISDNLMQIVSTEEMCGYVYIFLNTEYGKILIRRFTYGGVVDAIEPEHIARVEIPLLKDKKIQQTINELALKASRKRCEAYTLEQDALRIMDVDVIHAK